ncbi:hypothetical protein [Mammaliicoccus stepanovicii]|uniref:Uncharacterized protein n=1 Tax=Mammaliicoccus stepanovicii TaxID=643214 RepID=A0A239Z3M2_9STAP|nr:hypothetical protein [Mammaliicoccus stepanovicii]PNZ78053.1 hypothetical protein CD111_02145 [Mammaliicoccus stepanovicii]GGI40245.1 hypothetical protein GCM10010896_07410 [Mammaliicoccus stepanovicii]SNV65226.1 Uncharacterised protein [Mammaliicoccus stepanovicii]
MQIITFILVILPVLYIISIFQRKSKQKINRKDFIILFALSILGMTFASIINTLTSKHDGLSFMFVIASIGASVVWGILVSLTILFLQKLLNK